MEKEVLNYNRIITEFEFDIFVAESIKEHDWNDEVIAAFGFLRKKIFGRVMGDMPEKQVIQTTIKMYEIMKG